MSSVNKINCCVISFTKCFNALHPINLLPKDIWGVHSSITHYLSATHPADSGKAGHPQTLDIFRRCKTIEIRSNMSVIGKCLICV